MADIKFFNIKGTVKEYQSSTVTLEKELQIVIENNMLRIPNGQVRRHPVKNLLQM